MSQDISELGKITISLVPSLPAKSFDEIQTLLDSLHDVISGIQIDIVDGKFAPHVSWPFTEENAQTSLKQLTEYNDLEIEMDCMCMNPETYLDTFVSIGVSRVVVHAESTKNYEDCIAHSRKHGYRIGLGIRNNTRNAFLDTYIPQFDYVQVMGIENIGVQGQSFDEKTFDTVKNLRAQYPHLEIAVDGGVNGTTIPLLQKAGANRFAPGSVISKSENPQEVYEQLWALL